MGCDADRTPRLDCSCVPCGSVCGGFFFFGSYYRVGCRSHAILMGRLCVLACWISGEYQRRRSQWPRRLQPGGRTGVQIQTLGYNRRVFGFDLKRNQNETLPLNKLIFFNYAVRLGGARSALIQDSRSRPYLALYFWMMYLVVSGWTSLNQVMLPWKDWRSSSGHFLPFCLSRK